MQTKWKKVLERLGCTVTVPDITTLQPCPICPKHGNTLQVHRDRINGNISFRCIVPYCNFSGNAIDLVARARNIPFLAAIKLFRTNGEFRDTISNPSSTDVILDGYANNQLNQTELSEYFNRCRQALLRTAKGIKLRQYLADAGVWRRSDKSFQTMPANIGLLLPNKIPSTLKDFERLYFKKGYYTIFPYTYNNYITKVKVQNAKDLQEQHTKKLAESDCGIFMEDNLTGETDHIIVALSELAACAVYSKFKQLSTFAAPVVALNILQFPFRYHQAKSIIVLSTPKDILTLEKALEFFNTEHPIEGADHTQIRVCDIQTLLTQLPAIRLQEQINEEKAKMPSLLKWITRYLMVLPASERGKAVFQAFSAQSLSEQKQSALLDSLTQESAPQELNQLVVSANNQQQGRFMLGNGNVLHRTLQGFMAINKTGGEYILSNTIIIVNNCIKTATTLGFIYDCQVRTADKSIPILNIKLSETALKSGALLAKTIDAAFAVAGYKTYIAFYDRFGYRWRDIIARLAKDKQIITEIKTLGANDKSQIHFPNCVLRVPENDIIPQKGIFSFGGPINGKFSFSPRIKQLYYGINCPPNLSTTKLRKIITEGVNNNYIAGLIAGIAHTAYVMKLGLFCTEKEVAFTPRHLFYVEPESGLWQPIFQQLSTLFSNQDLVSTMPSETCRYLQNMSKLGSLPYITMLPTTDTNKLVQVITDAPVNLISIINSHTASLLSDNPAVSFVLPTDYTEQVCQLHADDIITLQKELPALLLKFVAQKLSQKEYAKFKCTTTIPALFAYSQIRKLFGIKHSLPDGLVQNYSGAIGATSAAAFFYALYTLLYAKSAKPDKLGIIFKTIKPDAESLKRNNPPHIFILDKVIVVSHQLVDAVNMQYPKQQHFSALSLGKEFYQQGYLVDAYPEIPRERYWILDKSIWEKYVMKIPLTWDIKKTGNLTQLKRIA